ncbi:MAG: branched-chain amino acid ABC transporter permease [Anaerotruncus sp.]|nr:branched-chain amino acid ABC transporter permease [Anaerotruncus sp.]
MRNKKYYTVSYLINAAMVLLLFLLLMGANASGMLGRYQRGIIITIFINIILAVSLNLTTGFLGQIALGHAGFMSIGAYTAALFVKYMQDTVGLELIIKSKVTPMGTLMFLLSLLLGGCVAALFGLLVGIPALRLKGDYLAIITLGFGEIIRSIIENLKFTGGAQGLKKIPKLAQLDTSYFVMIVCVVVMFMFVRSRHGRSIIAIREDDIASEACGIHNTYYKVMAFTVAAFFAGIAGGIYAQYLAILGAADFDFMKSIDILVMVVLGGMGSITGSILAAIGLTALPELLRSFSDYRMLLYSVVLIIVMIFKPSGLLGTYEFSLTRLLERLTGKRKQQTAKGGAK